jgi:hypothetical protein
VAGVRADKRWNDQPSDDRHQPRQVVELLRSRPRSNSTRSSRAMRSHEALLVPVLKLQPPAASCSWSQQSRGGVRAVPGGLGLSAMSTSS